MGPSSFNDIIDTYEVNHHLSCVLIHVPRVSESDTPILFSHPETSVSWSDWEEIEDEDFVQLVTRNEVLCPESSLCLRFWNRHGCYPFMDLHGHVLLNEMSTDVFYVSRTFQGHAEFQRNFRVPCSLIVAWTFLGFPAEVHFYSGENECEQCGTTHPIFHFCTSPDNESEEQIKSAMDISLRNRSPPRHPTIPISSFLTN